MSKPEPTTAEPPADEPAVLNTAELAGTPAESLRTVAGATQLIETAIANGLASYHPHEVGDVGMAFVVPPGYDVETLKATDFEAEPRLSTFRQGLSKFVGVESLAHYVNRYKSGDTLAFVTDVYGQGTKMLTSDTNVAQVQIDDHPTDGVGRRAHLAVLVLRPTAAARRWGGALAASSVSQEGFLDLIVEGIAEIAEPDGAHLRDLVSDLHAIRSTEVKSVIRTGGEGSIELAENVKLTAGTGDKVTFPEQMTVMFAPFAGVGDSVTLTVRIKPTVNPGNHQVVFALTCADLDDHLARVIGTIAGHITESTELTCHWVP